MATVDFPFRKEIWLGTITDTIVTAALVYGGRHEVLTISFKRAGRTYNSVCELVIMCNGKEPIIIIFIYSFVYI